MKNHHLDLMGPFFGRDHYYGNLRVPTRPMPRLPPQEINKALLRDGGPWGVPLDCHDINGTHFEGDQP